MEKEKCHKFENERGVVHAFSYWKCFMKELGERGLKRTWTSTSFIYKEEGSEFEFYLEGKNLLF